MSDKIDATSTPEVEAGGEETSEVIGAGEAGEQSGAPSTADEHAGAGTSDSEADASGADVGDQAPEAAEPADEQGAAAAGAEAATAAEVANVSAADERADESETEQATAGDPGCGKDKVEAEVTDKVELPPAIAALDDARRKRRPVSGKVIGWNKGGFHVALGETPAFCPRSAMELGEPGAPESYLNREMDFLVLEIRKGGKRVVVSRAGAIRAEHSAQRKQAMAEVKPGAVLTGSVVSLTDFGAFVDLGGVQGLLHVSEISRSRVEHPSDALDEGQQIEVKVLKVEKGGKRISLSRKALEPDPWRAIGEFSEGQEIEGKVERAEKFGVLVELAPGLSGLIPSSALSLPADASPQRVFPPGKELKVQIVSIDKKRKRISLLPQGAQVDGSKKDLEEYRQKQGEHKLGALAAAFEKARSDS